MPRKTGDYRISNISGGMVRAFVPDSLPPRNPPLVFDAQLNDALTQATSALGKLAIAGTMVPSADWSLYGFVRKEAVISSQIEGTQATLEDVLNFEATEKAEQPQDVEEVCNYVEALGYARKELKRPSGLPVSSRLLCAVHKRLMKGVRGADKQPGKVRTSQNWIGGTRPGNATFIPPPPEFVQDALSDLDQWLHRNDDLAPLVRVGLAHVQFETIHPFLDGNGRVGRLLIALLVEHWQLLPAPLLYLSLAFKRHRVEYYAKLSAVRSQGDWEGWSLFFLECVRQAAEDGVTAAQKLFALLSRDRQLLVGSHAATIPAIRLFDELPKHPVLTLQRAIQLLGTTKPTAAKAITALEQAEILRETTGRQRDRIYAYHDYLQVLTKWLCCLSRVRGWV